MTSRFTGRVALVTGASRGIGLAVARRIVAEGGRVCLTARKEDGLRDAVASLGPEYAIGVAGRSDDEEHRSSTVARVLDAYGRLDVLVNNTGINPAYGPLLDLDLGAARKTLEVNVVAALGWVREAYRGWLGAHGGAVVNVASVAGLRPAGGIGLYGVSKAALIQLTAQLAMELGPAVRVNAVAPAVVKTRFATALYEGREEEVAQAYPLRRLGVPADVASAVAYLASDDAEWVTGQTLAIDGGITLTGGV
ncbi:SDR family oxidoreductase [Rugosimonospora africana]|uniref:SDR family oxidoreductase n=1 Tax=Rugosimonospora africana TaxID=556532 RepID=UPI00194203E1|nr:SDR family oxidoreductase [Rugosimonospora africana]